MPEDIIGALAMGRMTALKKSSERVRGIVAGSILRRLIGKSLTKEFSDIFLEATKPFQFALQTRAGMDAICQIIRMMTDLDDSTVVLSLDGIGAFDHVKRSTILQELLDDPSLSPLLPFVRLWYSRTSHFLWTDAENVTHSISQEKEENKEIH